MHTLILAINCFLTITFGVIGLLLGWYVYRRGKRYPINLNFYLIAIILILSGPIFLFLYPGLRTLSIVLPDNNGCCVQLQLMVFTGLIAVSLILPAVSCYLFLNKNRFYKHSTIVTIQILLFYSIVPACKISGSRMLVDRKSKDGIILQSSGYSCAAASCANLVNYFGIQTSEKEMAVKLGIDFRGAGMRQIIYVLRNTGLRCKRTIMKTPNINAVTPPAALAVYHPITGPETHVITYMAKHKDKFEIWDPLSGKCYFNEKQLYEIWEGDVIEVKLN